jgi:hypothetical protein
MLTTALKAGTQNGKVKPNSVLNLKQSLLKQGLVQHQPPAGRPLRAAHKAARKGRGFIF